MPIVGSLGNAAEVAYGPPSDFNPNAFDFIDLVNVEPLDGGVPRVVYSNTYQILGIKSGLGVFITCTEKVTSTEEILEQPYLNAEYAITNSVPADVTTLSYTNDPFTVLPDQYITLRLTLEPTIPADNPSSFDKTTIFFNDYNPRFSSVDIPVSANERGYNLTYCVDLTIGQTQFDWIVKTRGFDTTPLPFAFTGQELNPPLGAGSSVGSPEGINKVVYTDNTVTILGLETGYKFQISVEPDSFASISVDEKTPVDTLEVANGDILYVKSVTPSEYSSSLTNTIAIGNFSTTWTVQTEAENLNIIFTPDDFVDVPAAATSVVYESNEITLSGFSTDSDLPAQGSEITSSYYQIQRETVGIGTTVAKDYEDADIDVIEGDIIKLRMESSSEFDTTVTTTFTVGNTSADWNITTVGVST